MPEHMTWTGSRMLRELTSRECAAYLSGGGNLAVVPVGTAERMGRHLPLAAGTHIAEAVALALAEAGDGLVISTVPYSSLADTRSLPGSAHVEPRVMHRYLYDLCGELRANGFTRIVFVGAMTEGYYIVCDFFENEGMAPLWVDVNEIPLDGAGGRDERVTWLAAGALRLAGREDLLEKLIRLNNALYGRSKPSPRDDARFAVFREIGRVGYSPGKDEDDVKPVARVDADAGADAIRTFAQSRREALAALGEYNEHLSRRRFDRGVR